MQLIQKLRQHFFQDVEVKYSKFVDLNKSEKVIFIFNNIDPYVCKKLGYYVYEAFEQKMNFIPCFIRRAKLTYPNIPRNFRKMVSDRNFVTTWRCFSFLIRSNWIFRSIDTSLKSRIEVRFLVRSQHVHLIPFELIYDSLFYLWQIRVNRFWLYTNSSATVLYFHNFVKRQHERRFSVVCQLIWK